MKKINKFILSLLFVLSVVQLYPNSIDPECPIVALANDMSSASSEFRALIQNRDIFKAWDLLNRESPAFRTNVDELKLVSKNLAEINKAGGYTKWKSLQPTDNIINDFSNLLNSKGYSYLKNQFNALDDITKNKFMRNFPKETPDNILAALNDPKKGLLNKWKDGTIKGNPEGFDRYYYASNNPITHADIGDFKNPNNPSTSLESGKMTGGGHGQSNIDYLEATGKQYNIEHTFDNGVRTGNIPTHDLAGKRTGVGQSWFPSNWTKQEIDAASKYIIQKNQSAYNALADGVSIYDTYKGVRVGIIKTDGKFATIFPDSEFQPNALDQLIKNPKY